MQGINLARRPFVNRRPVLRLAILLWVVGAALAILNAKQYVGYWAGKAIYDDEQTGKLTGVDSEIREELAKLVELDRALAKVRLSHENRRTKFLNQLISYRTFPWSALFDDLEEVVPADVMLLSVKPSVKLDTEPERVRRKQRRGSSRPTTAPSASRTTADDAGDDSPATAPAAGSSSEAEEPPLRKDEVNLKLSGIAKTEDALYELIEVLYASPVFRSPFLPGEAIQQSGMVKFTISTVYLTRRPAMVPEEEPAEAAAIATERSETEGAVVAEAAGTAAVGIEPAAGVGPATDVESVGIEPAADVEPVGIESAAAEVPLEDRTESAETTTASMTKAHLPPTGETLVPGAAPTQSARPRNDASAVATRATGEAPRDSVERGPRDERPATTRPREPRALPGSRPARTLPGRALPGAQPVPTLPSSSGAPGSSPTLPDRVMPPASATPELSRGARLAFPPNSPRPGNTPTARRAEA